jgi:hypothetical protein
MLSFDASANDLLNTGEALIINALIRQPIINLMVQSVLLMVSFSQ